MRLLVQAILPVLLTASAMGTVLPIATNNLGENVASVDWSHQDRFLGAALEKSGTSDQFYLLSFQTNTIPTMATREFALNQHATSVRWHHAGTNLFVAVGLEGSADTNELFVYRLNSTNGAFLSTNSINWGTIPNANALAWQPGTTNVTVGMSGNISVHELQHLRVTLTNITTNATVDLSGSTRDVQFNALEWTSNGTYLAVGLIFGSSPLPVAVYRWSGPSLVFSGAVGNSAFTYPAVAWNPAGDLLAAGANVNLIETNSLFLYSFSSTGPITQISGALSNKEGTTVNALDWAPFGNALAVGMNATSNGPFRIYQYDATDQTLETLYSNATTNATSKILSLRWSRSGDYIATGDDLGRVIIYRVLFADLAVSKTGTPSTVLVGSNIVYSIAAGNGGPYTAATVRIVDTLPTNTTFVSASAGCTHSNGIVNCFYSNLAVNAAVTATVTVTLSPFAVGSITNRVRVSGTTLDKVPGNNSATVVTITDTDPDGDGVGSLTDNCLSNSNPSQANSDFDVYGDACDNCPTNFNPSQTNTDFDAFGDACDFCPTIPVGINVDTDGDGFGNGCDNCEAVSNASQSNVDGDAFGDACDCAPLVPNTGFNWDGDSLEDACDPDDDNDGLPDDWEILYGFNPLSPSLPGETYDDPDGDGSFNIEEYVAGTDPTSGLSIFEIIFITNSPPARVVFPSLTGRTYEVHYSTNLPADAWLDLYTNVLGSNVETSVTDPSAATGRAYRVRIRMTTP